MTNNEMAIGSCGFGTTIDAETVFTLLDRYVDEGGRIVDTANNYSFWDEGATGDEAELVIGRWLASRRPEGVEIATKLGARPSDPADWPGSCEGLSAAAIRESLDGSLRRLGVDRVDTLYVHVEDRTVPLEETVGALHEQVLAGKVGRLGISNHAVWRVERARNIAAARGWTPFSWLQYRHSYLSPRPDAPLSQGGHFLAGKDLLDYVEAHGDLRFFAYTSMLFGAYAGGRPLPEAYEHRGTDARLAALKEVADEVGATTGQVVLSWLMEGPHRVVPILGTSRLATLNENLAARDVHLTAGQRARLDDAG